MVSKYLNYRKFIEINTFENTLSQLKLQTLIEFKI